MRGRVPKYPPLWRARVVVWVLLVALLVFPGAGCLTFGPGCCMCPWAAARPLAVRAASFARRVVSKPGQALPPPTDTAAMPSGASAAPSTPAAPFTPAALCSCVWRSGPAAAHGHRSHALRALRTHVVSCVADPGGRILVRTVGIVLREVADKASPGPLRAFWSRGGCESMSGCDRASQAHTEAPGAVAPGALTAIRCDLSEPNATRSVAA